MELHVIRARSVRPISAGISEIGREGTTIIVRSETDRGETYRIDLPPSDVCQIVGQVPALRMIDHFGGDAGRASRFMDDLRAVLNINLQE